MKVIKIVALSKKAEELLLKKEKIPKITKHVFKIMKWDEEIICREPLTIVISFKKLQATSNLVVSTLFCHLKEKFDNEQLVDKEDYILEMLDQ